MAKTEQRGKKLYISNNAKERTEIKQYTTNNKSPKSAKCVKERKNKKITLIFDKII